MSPQTRLQRLAALEHAIILVESVTIDDDLEHLLNTLEEALNVQTPH